eukprot:scaffold1216_cov164-Isochrysis_galbana.AAC.2
MMCAMSPRNRKKFMAPLRSEGHWNEAAGCGAAGSARCRYARVVDIAAGRRPPSRYRIVHSPLRNRRPHCNTTLFTLFLWRLCTILQYWPRDVLVGYLSYLSSSPCVVTLIHAQTAWLVLFPPRSALSTDSLARTYAASARGVRARGPGLAFLLSKLASAWLGSLGLACLLGCGCGRQAKGKRQARQKT